MFSDYFDPSNVLMYLIQTEGGSNNSGNFINKYVILI